MHIKNIQNIRTKFTRMNIGEAIVSQLKKVDLKQLKVLAITKRAGVSRMTFYKYYQSPTDALEDYLHIIISEYLEAADQPENSGSYLTYDHILFSLRFFDQYRSFFLTMYTNDLYSILINSVNDFMKEHIQTSEQLSIYQLYSYAGALLNSFLMWEVNGKKESAEDVARTIYVLYGQQRKE